MEKRKGNRNSLGGKIEMWPKNGFALYFSLRLLGYERLVGFTLSCTAYTHNDKAVGMVSQKG
jgi:hypothetical protein